MKKIIWKLNLVQMMTCHLKFCLMTITTRSDFEKDGKLYPQIFLGDTLYELSI